MAGGGVVNGALGRTYCAVGGGRRGRRGSDRARLWASTAHRDGEARRPPEPAGRAPWDPCFADGPGAGDDRRLPGGRADACRGRPLSLGLVPRLASGRVPSFVGRIPAAAPAANALIEDT
jgi:hypothetical protein